MFLCSKPGFLVIWAITNIKMIAALLQTVLREMREESHRTVLYNPDLPEYELFHKREKHGSQSVVRQEWMVQTCSLYLVATTSHTFSLLKRVYYYPRVGSELLHQGTQVYRGVVHKWGWDGAWDQHMHWCCIHSNVGVVHNQSIHVPTPTYGHELWVVTKRMTSWIQVEKRFLHGCLGSPFEMGK